jgi:uncharacterized FlaG/YvyC family protein
MKTFAQFLQQLEEAKSYRKVYASKVAAARQRQSDDIENRKKRFMKQREQEQEKKEHDAEQKREEDEHKEYVKHVDRLRNDIRQEIKQEYGIKDKK